MNIASHWTACAMLMPSAHVTSLKMFVLKDAVHGDSSCVLSVFNFVFVVILNQVPKHGRYTMQCQSTPA